jgi:hypothetical protein
MKPPDREMHTKGNHKHYTIIKGNLCDKESQNFAEVNRKEALLQTKRLEGHFPLGPKPIFRIQN